VKGGCACSPDTRLVAVAGKEHQRADQIGVVDVVWLPKKWGKTLKVTRINGVAEKLKLVSAELDELSADKDIFLKQDAA
jgi:hypothetical protein